MNAVANPISIQLRNTFTREYSANVIDLIKSDPSTLGCLADLAIESLVQLAERCDPVILCQLFDALPKHRQVELLEQSTIRTSLTVLKNLDAEQTALFLGGLSVQKREDILAIQQFPENMAGHYADSSSVYFHAEDTIETTLRLLKESRAHRTRSIYVVDSLGVLQGRADMQDIAVAEAGVRLVSLIHPVQGWVTLTTPREELIEIFNRYRVDSTPIVDQDHKLVGVVRYASLFLAAEESMTSDIQKMVGVSPEERALSSPVFAVKKRLPWLHINLLTAFLAASVVGFFEATIAQFTALAILLPVVAGQSGNAGSQALAVTMRGLALREINLAQWKRVLLKEVTIGVIDGVALAITCGLGVFVWSQSVGLAIVIGIAMIISMIAAGISGALVPMVLIRVGQDPATASSIILTTVTDVAGFISFLGTATLLASIL
ncbi:MAG: magnesium transporter [Candidatus Azotimanducaceae bacterium]|jgi:magnesium transporter